MTYHYLRKRVMRLCRNNGDKTRIPLLTHTDTHTHTKKHEERTRWQNPLRQTEQRRELSEGRFLRRLPSDPARGNFKARAEGNPARDQLPTGLRAPTPNSRATSSTSRNLDSSAAAIYQRPPTGPNFKMKNGYLQVQEYHSNCIWRYAILNIYFLFLDM